MVNVSFFVCLYTFYIQLVMINHLSACGEYEPYHFVDTEQEFEEMVIRMK